MNNLVNWQPWSRDTFSQARAENKPVFLCIERFWCGYSRLMDQIAWNDPEIAEALNNNYIPIRLDGGAYPAIVRRFFMGDYPSLVFLTPEALPITASRFVPPDVLLNALTSVAESHHKKSKELTARLIETENAREALQAARFDPNRRPSPWMTGRILEFLLAAADQDNGGFGEVPKAPAFDAIQLLLLVYSRTGESRYGNPAFNALLGMYENGLYDWEDGGFFRLSDEPDWSSPRLEKLLEDQARHLTLYTYAFHLTQEMEYAEAAAGTLEWLRRFCFDAAEGYFRASMAADPVYYTSTSEDKEYQDPPETEPVFATSATSQLISSLIYYGYSLGDADAVGLANRLFSELHARLIDTNTGLPYRQVSGDDTPVPGVLADCLEYALMLLEWWQYSGDQSSLDAVKRVSEAIVQEYSDPRQPGLMDSRDPLGLGKISSRDMFVQDNALAAVLFARLGWLTQNEAWLDRSEKILWGWTGVWEQLGLEMASYGLALFERYREPVIVQIPSSVTDSIRSGILALVGPGVLVRWVKEGDLRVIAEDFQEKCASVSDVKQALKKVEKLSVPAVDNETPNA